MSALTATAAGLQLAESAKPLAKPLRVEDLKVKIFADGASKDGILELYGNPAIQGFTTNPTLMRKAGIEDYESFARDLIESIPDRHLSLEVFADEFDEMYRQAVKIASWGENVYVKIPITNTRGESTRLLLRRLAEAGVKINVTALMTLEQVRHVAAVAAQAPAACISVFAGRVADSGRDPVPLMRDAVNELRSSPNVELIWASPREILNIVQAHEVGCHIITVTHALLGKLATIGKDLDAYSLETVQMFRSDAVSAGYSL